MISTTRSSTLFRKSRQQLCFAVILLLPFALIPLPGMAEVDLYTVAVPLDSTDPSSRDKAYKMALSEVLVRVTGSGDEAHLASLGEIFPNAARYVLRYRPAPENALEVTFDGVAIERMLRQARYAVWGADRPLTLVWLAVDWGQGAREIVAADEAMPMPNATRSIDRNHMLRQRMENTADLRGIPMAFPLLDAEDLESISFSDVWGGFDDKLLEASRRYGANSILVGRVSAESPQRNRWTFYFGKDRLSWSGEPEQVTQLVADELAANLAIPGNASLETIALSIDGVNSTAAYGAVQQMMHNLSVVEDFALRSVVGTRVDFSVRIYGGIDRLNKALELSGILQPAVIMDAEPGSRPPLPRPDLLMFRYRPQRVSETDNGTRSPSPLTDIDLPD